MFTSLCLLYIWANSITHKLARSPLISIRHHLPSINKTATERQWQSKKTMFYACLLNNSFIWAVTVTCIPIVSMSLEKQISELWYIKYWTMFFFFLDDVCHLSESSMFIFQIFRSLEAPAEEDRAHKLHVDVTEEREYFIGNLMSLANTTNRTMITLQLEKYELVIRMRITNCEHNFKHFSRTILTRFFVHCTKRDWHFSSWCIFSGLFELFAYFPTVGWVHSIHTRSLTETKA